jgi:hypothetical protein
LPLFLADEPEKQGIGKERQHPMPTKGGFILDPLPLFLADEPEKQGIGKVRAITVISSRVLKAGILVATGIGIAILSGGSPVVLFADLTSSALEPGTDQSTLTIQPTADAQALPPTGKDAPTSDEIVAASAGQSQTENSEPSSEDPFRQFQSWAAEKAARAQVGPVQSVQDAPAQVADNARAPVRQMQKHRHVKPVDSVRAEIRPVENPQKKVRREQNARAQVPPAQDARIQDQSVQNAQFLQTLGRRN